MPGDIAVQGNYNGTGITLPAVYRPSTGQWFIYGNSKVVVLGGQSGDVPVPGDYDNTGTDEQAIYRPSTGQWLINSASGVRTITFGGPTYVPVPGAYDAGISNHAVEPAVYSPTTGKYLVYHAASGSSSTYTFPANGIPTPGDYSGNGITEPAVYVPSTGTLMIATPNGIQSISFGNSLYVPPNSPYQYRLPTSGTTTTGPGTGIGSAGITVSPGDLGSTAHTLSNGSGTSSSASTGSAPAPISVKISRSRTHATSHDYSQAEGHAHQESPSHQANSWYFSS